MKGLVISPNFPDRRNPERGAFVKQLVDELTGLGLNLSVISPKSISRFFKEFGNKNFFDVKDLVSVERPLYPTFSNRKILGFDPVLLNTRMFSRSTSRTSLVKQDYDFYYGKFLLTGGAAAVALGRQNSKPAFIDLGESRLLETMTSSERQLASSIVKQATGIICVSDRLKSEAVELGAEIDNVVVIPNQANPLQFKPMNQFECREKLGLPFDHKLVVFVGHFIERKGVHYVEDAIRTLRLSGKQIKGVFIGKGDLEPDDDVAIFKGTVPHDELPLWLNACDVFCLPTLAEGNCNAINEALAVGLKLIISDIPDLDFQAGLGRDSVFRVDPLDLSAIVEGISSVIYSQNGGNYNIGSCLTNGFSSRGDAIHEFLLEKIS